MIITDPDSVEARGELADIIEALAEKVAPRAETVLRADAWVEGQRDDELWRRLSGELGAVAMTVPERLGGSGAGAAEMAVIFEAAGRHFFAVPLLGAWLGLEALVRARCEDVALLGPLVRGERVAALALPPAPLSLDTAGDRPLITGELHRVIDADQADVLVVPVEVDGDPAWAVVDRTEMSVEKVPSLDLVRSLATVRLEAADVRAVVSAAAPGSDLVSLLDLARLMLASEQMGVIERAVADSVAYAREREQFGRPIGSFQVIKHLAADMATESDLARSLVEHAVWAAVEEPERFPEAVAMALSVTSQVAVKVSAENVQIHGGIGFTWEHTAHLGFRRARSNAVLLGDRFELAEVLFAHR